MADKRIDWPSMMVFDKDRVQDLQTHPDAETAHEKAEDAVYFQYLEKSERITLDSAGEASHNPMMHVDGHLSAQDAFSSLPHWAWFEDTV